MDFSRYKQPGTYYIELTKENGDVIKSHSFVINEKAISDSTLALGLQYFRKSRTAGEVNKYDAAVPVFNNSNTIRDVRGGWYDASGDISKYFSALAYTNYLTTQHTPVTVWCLAYIYEQYDAMLHKAKIKEQWAGEITWGADFLVRMFDKEGFFYANVFDSWSGQLDKRELCAYSGSKGLKNEAFQCAFREGGGTAIAALARTAGIGLAGEFTADRYRVIAEKAYNHLKEHNLKYCDDGKENLLDHQYALMAAVELYTLTKNKDYLKDAHKRAEYILELQDKKGWWYVDSQKTRAYYHPLEEGVPVLVLKLLLEVTHINQNPFGYARRSFHYEGVLRHDFFMPRNNETNYWWAGENGRIGSLAAAALLGSHLLTEKYAAKFQKELKQYAIDQIDWILGKNPFGYCMFRGVGHVNSKDYGHTKYGHTDLDGGIANGIHSANSNGSGIDFITKDETWRSTEQWIPHTTWYLLAISVMKDIGKNGVPD
ncbi:MAG: glycoside hydrolase family 9 protein [Bacteroidota bacterium]|nr:glycoside hydrolase family 9 protein [Bacteroidota bacterium]